jgi:hypothetical protein
MPGGDPPRAAEEIPAHEAAEKTFPFLNDWELVMLVSFTEAYLEDLLILLSRRILSGCSNLPRASRMLSF